LSRMSSAGLRGPVIPQVYRMPRSADPGSCGSSGWSSCCAASTGPSTSCCASLACSPSDGGGVVSEVLCKVGLDL
jgi:hypothetical protein